MTVRHRAKYKPLLFTTTLRNPERLKRLLHILLQFDGQVLSNDLAKTIMGELMRWGLYRPTRGVTSSIEKKWGTKRISERSPIGVQLLDDEEIQHLYKTNPQQHKEAGFAKGWPSRFATEYDLAKEFGFVYYWPGEKILFSEIGLQLTQSVDMSVREGYILSADVKPELEQQAFLHALAKYQRNNPFVRVLNENAPLILLLEVIKKLNADRSYRGAGILKLELPLVIYWKDADAEALYQRIKKLRTDFGYTPSKEVISDICRNEIMGGTDIVRNPKSIAIDYPDEFIRKMRLTGLISLRGGGRFVDINKKEQAKVDYVLDTYARYKKYPDEKSYFAYVSRIDPKLLSKAVVPTKISEKIKSVEKWVGIYSWDSIKKELMILGKKTLTRDEVLKYLPAPVRLEFLTSLAVKSKFSTMIVVPNYPIDDEGLPTATAGGANDTGDIECSEKEEGALIEVTMAEGRVQTVMEVWPITRHLKEFQKKFKEARCLFIAPSIFIDSQRQISYVMSIEALTITAKTVEEFITHLESSPTL